MSLLNYFKDLLGKYLSQKCIESPVFIVGSGRSGTSVLLQALGKHPDIIALAGEAPFLTSIGGNAALFRSDNAEYYLNSLKTDIHYLFSSLSRLGLETAGGKHYAFKGFIRSLLRGELKRKKLWAAKTFPSERVTNGLLEVYPKAKILYITRNGIDVVHSMTKFHGFRTQTFVDQCQGWSDSVEKYRYLLHHNNALFLRQEDLLSNPDEFFKSIFDFLNIEYSPKSIDFTKNNIVHPLDQPSKNQQDIIFQLKKRQSPFTSWTTEQKKTFILICSNAMKELKYPIPNPIHH